MFSAWTRNHHSPSIRPNPILTPSISIPSLPFLSISISRQQRESLKSKNGYFGFSHRQALAALQQRLSPSGRVRPPPPSLSRSLSLSPTPINSLSSVSLFFAESESTSVCADAYLIDTRSPVRAPARRKWKCWKFFSFLPRKALPCCFQR